MGGEVSGLGGDALVGMLLLEHQRQLVREGKAERDVAHELAIDAKKVGNIFDAMDKNAKDFEKTMGNIELGMQLVAGVGQVSSIKSSMEQANAIEALPKAERAAAFAKQEAEAAKGADPKTFYEKAKFWLPEAEKHFHSLASPLAQAEDEKNKKSGEQLKKVGEGYEKLTDKAREMTQKEQDVANEAYKIGTAFLSRQG